MLSCLNPLSPCRPWILPPIGAPSKSSWCLPGHRHVASDGLGDLIRETLWKHQELGFPIKRKHIYIVGWVPIFGNRYDDCTCYVGNILRLYTHLVRFRDDKS